MLVAGVAAGVSWAAATRLESPEQAEARARPPTPIPVTATVREGPLRPPLSVSGTVVRESTANLTADRLDGAVVTSVDAGRGTVVRAGRLLMKLDGRPLFVLPGPFPLYRDLAGGESGDDVAVLQSGLEAAGHPFGRDRHGTFGPGTKAALGALYESAGVGPPLDADAHEELARVEVALRTGPTDAALLERREALRVVQGPRLLLTEVVTTPALPATIDVVLAVGARARAGEPLAVLGAGRALVRATVPAAASTSVAVGATGEIMTSGHEGITATVEEVAPLPPPGPPGAENAPSDPTAPDPPGSATDDGGLAEIVMSAGPAELEVGAEIVVAFAHPDGDAAEHTLVPTAAVVTRGGRSLVYRREGDRFREVEVVVRGTEGGVAAIDGPPDGDRLPPGAEVRVGDG
jgi:hypothetical protein